MAVNNNDEYYTPDDLVTEVISTLHTLGLSISKYVEPSAGSGAFLPHLPEDTIALDINPQSPLVSYGDFLTTDFEYNKGLCVIGNPPFGNRNSLAVKFFKKSVNLGDYVAFILPISQLNNQQQMFEFDLIYSENLGVRTYSGVSVHCCFNVYQRPEDGQLNKTKPLYEVPGVYVKEYRRGGNTKIPKGYVWGMSTFGHSCGKEVIGIGDHCQQHFIYCDDPTILDKVSMICRGTDWQGISMHTSTPKLQTWRIMRYIKDHLGRY